MTCDATTKLHVSYSDFLAVERACLSLFGCFGCISIGTKDIFLCSFKKRYQVFWHFGGT